MIIAGISFVILIICLVWLMSGYKVYDVDKETSDNYKNRVMDRYRK